MVAGYSHQPPLSASGSSITASNPSSENDSSISFWQRFNYYGQRSHLPTSFLLPKGNSLSVWQLWCCGDKVKKIPPPFQVEPKTMHDRNMAKRFSDIRLLCKTIARICEVRGEMDIDRIVAEECTIQEVNAMYFFAKKHLPNEEEITCSRKTRRPNHHMWPTMVKYIQRCRKSSKYEDIFPLPQ